MAAFLVAALNVYAYFNPDFQLSRYSVVHLVRAYKDKQKKADLEKIKDALEAYYDENSQYPGYDGWCGRIFAMLNPDVKDAISPYFENGDIPQDPSFKGTEKDYFYRREDRRHYVLLVVLESEPADSETYNYEGCHDWPGDNIYNYRVTSSR